jgi:hypothetical protein
LNQIKTNTFSFDLAADESENEFRITTPAPSAQHRAGTPPGHYASHFSWTSGHGIRSIEASTTARAASWPVGWMEAAGTVDEIEEGTAVVAGR